MLLSEFSHAERISVCPGTIICNKCEQINMRGDILNAGDNIDDQENFGFIESYFKISPTNIYDYTKNKLLNIQQENLRPQRNIEINGERTYKRYQKNMIDEEKIIEDIEIMKLQILSSKKIYIYLEEKSDKINSKDMSDNMDSDKRKQIKK